MQFETTVGTHTHTLDIKPDEQLAVIEDATLAYSFESRGNGRHMLRMGNRLFKIDNVSFDQRVVECTINGHWCRVEVRNEQDLLMDEMGFKTAADIGEGQLKAPMPGKMLEIMVAEGDEVALGQPVAILEAMKMENELKAPVDGVITSIHATEGDSLEKNALILEIEARG